MEEILVGCVVLVVNIAWYLFNFRCNLICCLLVEGFMVVAICFFDEYVF